MVNSYEISITQKESTYFKSPLSTEWRLESSPELLLLINKIACEYYAYCNFPLEPIYELLTKVHKLDTKLDNVIFCNFKEEVREFENKEITHLVTIQNDSESGVLFAYIELFNTICAIVPLIKEYDGEDLNVSFRQEVISGEKVDGEIFLNKNISSYLVDECQNVDLRFEILVNKLTYRLRELEFENILNSQLEIIKKQVDEEVSNGSLPQNQIADELVKRSAKMVAQLTLMDFPYMVEDFKDEENDSVNYLHSNLKEDQFTEFCSANSVLIGKEIEFSDEGIYVFDSFYKQSFLEKNGIKLVTVFCVLSEKSTGRKRYIPYRDFYEGINIHGKES